MHERIGVGDVLQINQPRNHFALVPAKRYLLLAGGIGITPILCMAESLSSACAEFELRYCTRSVQRTAFAQRIAASPFVANVRFHHDTGADAQKLDVRGLLASSPSQTHLFVCGPTGFIDYVVETARNGGWPAEQVHLERFGAVAADTSAHAAFDVCVASSGKTFSVPGGGKTVIEVLAGQGIFRCPARPACAGPVSRPCWKASRTTAMCTSRTRNTQGTISSRPAARARKAPCSCWISERTLS